MNSRVEEEFFSTLITRNFRIVRERGAHRRNDERRKKKMIKKKANVKMMALVRDRE